MWDFLTGIYTQNFMRGALEKVFWGKYHVRCIPLAPARACLLGPMPMTFFFFEKLEISKYVKFCGLKVDYLNKYYTLFISEYIQRFLIK